MTPFGHVWPHLALLATFRSVGSFWPFLAPFDPVWPRLTLFGTIWHYLAPFGPAWPLLPLLGHSSIFISRYFKVPIRQGDSEVHQVYKNLTRTYQAKLKHNSNNDNMGSTALSPEIHDRELSH